MPSKWVVICCPVAGKKTAVATVKDVLVPNMEKLGLPVEVVYTEKKSHATELAEKYASPDTGLIAVGGDGTIHEVMDGLINKKMLSKVCLGLLSQGTMNFYAISGGLPLAATLPEVIKKGSFRDQGLMKCTDDEGKVNTMCFEALYFGVGYKPAKGAQVYRSSRLGPMFGIMSQLVKACAFPSGASVTGKLTITPADGGKPLVLQDTFFWIVVCQRSPYNGVLGDDMWVSYLTLKEFPGFARMMDFFAPEMELFSGMSYCFENHVKAKKFEWVQETDVCGIGKPSIGVCLDGDPTDAGSAMTVVHVPRAWRIYAEKEYPKRVPPEKTRVGQATPCATRWLAENPPPDGVWQPPPAQKAKSGFFPYLVAAVVFLVSFLFFQSMIPAHPDAPR